MSNSHWNVENYREEYECDEHWELRKAFMERWKDNYDEERLVCLARVFTNIEFMGCRYPNEVMLEIANLSKEVANSYRQKKKTKLQRTFVSASTAAEDRARGIKRTGGVICKEPESKTSKICFVPQGHSTDESANLPSNENSSIGATSNCVQDNAIEKQDVKSSETLDINNYLEEMLNIKCIDVKYFKNSMFMSRFGKFVLIIRPWCSKLSNILASCQASHLNVQNIYENGHFELKINGNFVTEAHGLIKAEAKSIIEINAWNILKEECVSVLVKEQWIAQGEAISVGNISGNNKSNEFGVPVDNSVATKMMKLMGWKGGGLGAEAQGISEPIKPHLQMVNRAGLGSSSSDVKQLRRAGQQLMQRYIASDSLDVDLVFSSEFSKEERATLHQMAQRAGLASKSYGADDDRFLVVKKKLDPFNLVKAVIEKGGNTPKYQVFVPAKLMGPNR